MKLLKNKFSSFTRSDYSHSNYDYSGIYEREETAANLLDKAVKHKESTEIYWKKMRRYYDGKHDIQSSCEIFSDEQNLPWIPCQSTDGYIHVETQIEPDVPDFEFNPRNADDADKAKQRESIVKYVCDKNDMKFMNSRNERRLNVLGSAVWKVCRNASGEVIIDNPSPELIYTDPSATTVDECEYIAFVYKMHIQKAKRVFASDFENSGTSIDDYLSNRNTAFSNSILQNDNDSDDTVTVTEWWFRQPDTSSLTVSYRHDGKSTGQHYKWNSGDIALCIFINGKEVRYVPKYWNSTSCQMYPFVIYNKIPNDSSVWGKSELEQIIPLIDAKDRDLAYAQLNSAFASNDIILAEENALSDGQNFDNSPGAVWKLRPGMSGKIQRLGNLSSGSLSLQSLCSRWESMIENTTGNFDVNQGREPTNVTTATGIALLNERAKTRKNLKNIDRNAGFKRLFSLIDYTSLECFDDGKVFELGAVGKDDIIYRYSDFTKKNKNGTYIPVVDVVIHTGSGMENSKAFTVSALSTLAGLKINADNYKFIKAYIDAIGIPERAEICDFLEARFGQQNTLPLIQTSPENESKGELTI